MILMNIPGAVLPIIGSVSMFMTIFGIMYLKTKENMALIERGINPKQNKAMPSPFTSLKYGLLILGCGAGLAMAFIVDHMMDHRMQLADGTYAVRYDDNSPALYFALIAIGGGLGLVISYFVERKAWTAIDKYNNQ